MTGAELGTFAKEDAAHMTGEDHLPYCIIQVACFATTSSHEGCLPGEVVKSCAAPCNKAVELGHDFQVVPIDHVDLAQKGNSIVSVNPLGSKEVFLGPHNQCQWLAICVDKSPSVHPHSLIAVAYVTCQQES